MKNRLLLLFTLFTCTGIHAIAGFVPVEKAQTVAVNVYQERFKARYHAASSLTGFEQVIVQANALGDPLIYIFNTPGAKGFVIIAAQDNVHPVLAYTFNGSYDPAIEHPGFVAWMDNYKQQIDYCLVNNLQPDASIIEEWGRYSDYAKYQPPVVANVGPLLTTTWNQGCNYNAQCPVITGGQCGRAWTGCGATAMAQVMKYWNHPVTGTGSNSYSWSSQLLTANFGATAYNWGGMPNNVTSSAPAVAELMYHCGVALEMNYGSGGSYCFFDFSQVMPQYFGYASTATNWIRLFVPDQQTYEDRIAAELDSGRVCPYKGSDANLGAHFFVCDGYQGTFPYSFHFNWGWGGLYDGYYTCAAMNPGSYAFVGSQGAVIRVQPSSMPTAVEDNTPGSTVSLFPNPVSDRLQVNVEHMCDHYPVITLMDITGRVISTYASGGNTVVLDVCSLPPSVYVVELKCEDAVVRKKFVKQ